MSYRKLKADYLFDGYRMLPAGSVLICDREGRIEEITDIQHAGGDAEEFSGMLVPGLVNCHCHLELSHMKGLIPEKQGLVDFVLSVMKKRFQAFPLKEQAILNAEKEMLDLGIVAVGDICNTADTGIVKKAKRLHYYNFVELLGWDPELAKVRYDAAEKLAHEFMNLGLDEEQIALVPHAPYSVSIELWELMKKGFTGKTVTIHNQESRAENELFSSGRGDLNRLYTSMNMDNSHFKAPGSSSLSYYLPALKEAGKILLVHNTFMNEPDLTAAVLFRKDLFLCLCPNANLYIENILPDIPMFMKHTNQIVLGTDSLASNHQLSILEEMKSIRKAFPKISSADMLVWATSNGAKALSFDPVLGDFKKGKSPGIVLIENLTHGEVGEESTSRRLV